MTRIFKEKEAKGFIERNIHSQKGDAGRVLIIGGEGRYTGCSVLAGLGALRAGCDSVTIVAPEQNARVMSAQPNFVVVKLIGNYYEDLHLTEIVNLSQNADVTLIGPGLGVSEERAKWLNRLIPKIHGTLVIDADATKQVEGVDNAIVLANKQEDLIFRRKNKLKKNTLVVKGEEDSVFSEEEEIKITGGHARATVGGTGDLLAGVISGLMAQKKEIDSSVKRKVASVGCLVLKKAAESIGDKLHFSFLASELVDELPETLTKLRIFRVTKYEPKPKKKNKSKQEIKNKSIANAESEDKIPHTKDDGYKDLTEVLVGDKSDSKRDNKNKEEKKEKRVKNRFFKHKS